MKGFTLEIATALKQAAIPVGVLNAAQHQRDIAMNYYMKATEMLECAEKQTVHRHFVRLCAEAETVFRKYRRHIRVADQLVRV